MNQVINYGRANGLTMIPKLGDGFSFSFATNEKSIVVVDGYSKFQRAEYINLLKETIPNSIFVVTVAKAKYRKDKIIDFSEQVKQFIRDCDYRCYRVNYGKYSEECLMVVKDRLDLSDKLVCQSLE